MYELKDLKMEIIDKKLAQEMIKKYHYSNSCGNLKFAFCFKYDKDIKNIIAYSSPIGRLVCQEIWENGNCDNTLELIRMISIEPKPKNLESYCIHKTFDYIKKICLIIKLLFQWLTIVLVIMDIVIKRVGLFIMDKVVNIKNILLMAREYMKELYFHNMEQLKVMN